MGWFSKPDRNWTEQQVMQFIFEVAVKNGLIPNVLPMDQPDKTRFSDSIMAVMKAWTVYWDSHPKLSFEEAKLQFQVEYK